MYIYIYNICAAVLEEGLYTFICHQVFLSYASNLHTVVLLQVFQSRTNNLYIIVEFQVIISSVRQGPKRPGLNPWSRHKNGT